MSSEFQIHRSILVRIKNKNAYFGLSHPHFNHNWDKEQSRYQGLIVLLCQVHRKAIIDTVKTKVSINLKKN